MNEAILVELKKMNEYLERIDWKLWNLHRKYVEGSDAAVSAPATAPATVAASAPKSNEFDIDVKPVNKTLTPVREQEAQEDVGIPVIPKYPSVERL